MKTKYLSVILALLLLLGLFAGCGSKKQAVYVQTVAEIMGYGMPGSSNVCAGVVVAQNEVKIKKDDNRTVSEVKVEVGQHVTTGQVLFTYDTQQMQLTIDQKSLEIEQLRNTVTDNTAKIAELKKAQDKASESDKLSYSVQIQALETENKEAQYNIQLKQQELDALKNENGTGQVTSPIDGIVKSVNNQSGNAANSSYDGSDSSDAFITLVQSGAYRVKGRINELNRNEYREGQTVTIRSRADKTMTWSGTIAEIDSNPESPQSSGMISYGGSTDEMTTSSNYPFYIDLDTPEGLMLGQHVYIEPSDGETDDGGIWLDESYVIASNDGGYFVWAANDKDELEKRSVTVGEYNDVMGQYEILDGLTLTDRIAWPEDTLEEGQPVSDTPVETDATDDTTGNGDIETLPNDGPIDDPNVYPDDYDNNAVVDPRDGDDLVPGETTENTAQSDETLPTLQLPEDITTGESTREGAVG